jgi:hypothetical protein
LFRLSLQLGGPLGLLLAVMMWLSTWNVAWAPVCGPLCQDARFSEAIGATLRGAAPAPAARRAVSAKLGMSPFDAGAWLRLAVLNAGGYSAPLTPSSVRALEQSYRFAPVDGALARWRVVYIFSHWREATPSLRRSAMWEAEILCASGSRNRQALARAGGAITDPAGRLAFELLIANLEARFAAAGIVTKA